MHEDLVDVEVTGNRGLISSDTEYRDGHINCMIYLDKSLALPLCLMNHPICDFRILNAHVFHLK